MSKNSFPRFITKAGLLLLKSCFDIGKKQNKTKQNEHDLAREWDLWSETRFHMLSVSIPTKSGIMFTFKGCDELNEEADIKIHV